MALSLCKIRIVKQCPTVCVKNLSQSASFVPAKSKAIAAQPLRSAYSLSAGLVFMPVGSKAAAKFCSVWCNEVKKNQATPTPAPR